jgi:dipeptidyl aminopeptidase/acylaminoacyl peptidase
MEWMFYQPQQAMTPPPSDRLPGAHVQWITTKDGLHLQAWFIPANGISRPARPAPTILHVHGNAGNMNSHVWFTEYLPAAGFNVFIFDYRGYGESQGAARKRGPLIEDTNAALDALLSRDDIDPNRIGVYGQSLGGSIAINVMANRPEIRAAVLESPFICWREMAACVVGGDPPGFVARALAALLISDDHRPLDVIERCTQPILLLHGDSDSIVPISHSQRLAESAGDRATLMVFPGGDHNSLRETNPEMEQVVIDFFSKHLQ